MKAKIIREYGNLRVEVKAYEIERRNLHQRICELENQVRSTISVDDLVDNTWASSSLVDLYFNDDSDLKALIINRHRDER